LARYNQRQFLFARPAAVFPARLRAELHFPDVRFQQARAILANFAHNFG